MQTPALPGFESVYPASFGFGFSFLPSFWMGKAMMERSLLYLLPSIAVAGGMGCGFVEEGLLVKEKRNSSEISAYSGRYGSLKPEC